MHKECPIIRATDPSYVISIPCLPPSSTRPRAAPPPFDHYAPPPNAARNFCHNSCGSKTILSPESEWESSANLLGPAFAPVNHLLWALLGWLLRFSNYLSSEWWIDTGKILTVYRCCGFHSSKTEIQHLGIAYSNETEMTILKYVYIFDKVFENIAAGCGVVTLLFL